MTRLPPLLLLGACALNGQRAAPHTAGLPVTRVATSDGASIALQRHPRPGAPAVLLCHGISSNHHFWDLDPDHSLAVHLYEAGYDVWNLDLRGHGFAVRGTDGRRPKPDWTIDSYGQHDLPAAIGAVNDAIGDQPLHYVGHSLGGMVLALYLADHPDPPLASATIVASPLGFDAPESLTRLLVGAAPRTKFIARWPTGWLAHGLVLMGPLAPRRVHAMLYEPGNLSPRTRRRMLRHIVSPMVRGEVQQLAQLSEGKFLSSDGSRTYANELGEVRLPMLFIAGRADHIAPPDGVRAYHDAVGSADRTWVMASSANGFTADYGHLDLGLGEAARTEVFPLIEQFITAHTESP